MTELARLLTNVTAVCASALLKGAASNGRTSSAAKVAASQREAPRRAALKDSGGEGHGRAKDWSAVCGLRSAVCGLRSAVCG